MHPAVVHRNIEERKMKYWASTDSELNLESIMMMILRVAESVPGPAWARRAVVFDSKELTNWDRFAGIVVMRWPLQLKYSSQLKTATHIVLNIGPVLPFGHRQRLGSPNQWRATSWPWYSGCAQLEAPTKLTGNRDLSSSYRGLGYSVAEFKLPRLRLLSSSRRPGSRHGSTVTKHDKRPGRTCAFIHSRGHHFL